MSTILITGNLEVQRHKGVWIVSVCSETVLRPQWVRNWLHSNGHNPQGDISSYLKNNFRPCALQSSGWWCTVMEPLHQTGDRVVSPIPPASNIWHTFYKLCLAVKCSRQNDAEDLKLYQYGFMFWNLFKEDKPLWNTNMVSLWAGLQYLEIFRLFPFSINLL